MTDDSLKGTMRRAQRHVYGNMDETPGNTLTLTRESMINIATALADPRTL